MSKIILKKVKNIRNFDHISGINETGIETQKYIRSSKLYKLSRKDKQILYGKYNVTTIIDLRTDTEIKEKPDSYPDNVDYHHISLINDNTVGITHEKGVNLLTDIPYMPDLYRRLVSDEKSVNGLKEVFKLIKEQENKEGAILWHCSEGKDRCGIVSALFLLFNGISKEEVMRDYLISDNVSKIKGFSYYLLVKKLLKDKKVAMKIFDAMRAKEEYLDAALDEIDSKYGCLENFKRIILG